MGEDEVASLDWWRLFACIDAFLMRCHYLAERIGNQTSQRRAPDLAGKIMKFIKLTIVCLVVFSFNMTAIGCQVHQSSSYGSYNQQLPPRPNTAGGAVVGGATGGIIGAAIGSKDDKTGEGALIGGILGAAAGGILGNQQDRANEFRDYQFQQQQNQYQRQQVQLQQEAKRNAVTFDQVITMSQSGLGPNVIVNQIKSQGIWQRPTASDLIFLKQNGVSDQVIGALQTGRIASEPAYPAQQVVVRERVQPVYVEPVVIRPVPRVYHPAPRVYHYGHRGHHHHRSRHAHGGGASFNIRF